MSSVIHLSFFVLGLAVFVFGPPVLWFCAWKATEVASGHTRERRRILSLMAASGLMSIVAYFLNLALSPDAPWRTVTIAAIYVGVAIEPLISPLLNHQGASFEKVEGKH